ncbi:hypothetical protein GCM10027047_29240 [Rhodococcus aerolatus]
MSPDARPAPQDGAPRPRAVAVAFWAWVVVGVGLVLIGMYLVTGALSLDPASLAGRGLTGDQVTAVRRGLGTFGVIAALVGLAVGFLGSRVRDGDPRARRAQVALSLVFTFVAVAQTVLGLVGILVLPLALVLLGCVVAVTRPSVSSWFHGDGPRSRPAAGGSAA